MKWRPKEGWIGNPNYCGSCIWQIDGAGACACCTSAFEAGADAGIAALMEHLMGKCTDHPVTQHDESGCPYQHCTEHRYLCPQCMSELKESVK